MRTVGLALLFVTAAVAAKAQSPLPPRTVGPQQVQHPAQSAVPAPLPPITVGPNGPPPNPRSPDTPPPSSAASSSTTAAITVGDRTRSYAMVRPADSAPRPTILLLHGAGGALMQLNDLPRLALGTGFVSVTPQGLGGRWNFFPPGQETQTEQAFFQRFGGPPDDAAFLQALAADLVARGIADPRRLYVAGLSLGGVMALRLACTGAPSFAAMALLIAGMEETTGAACRLAKPLPVLMARGTADPVIPDAGGVTARGDRVWSTERLVEFFRKLNGCAEAPTVSVAVQSPQRIEMEASNGCAGGPVVLYRVAGGGHAVPSTLNVNGLVSDFFRDKAR
jgi:polyhydroxybutyrate depolymerase